MTANSPKVAVVTFVYPLSLDYYLETIASIDKQDYDNFEKIVVADRVDLALCIEGYRVIPNQQSLGLIPLREFVFNQLLDEGYDLIINIDADDTMAQDRVTCIIDEWKETPSLALYYSPLHYMSDKQKAFFRHIPERVKSLSQVLENNCIGLSHMTINASLMREHRLRFSFPEYLMALDWYIVSWFLHLGFEAGECKGDVYYRIYEDNIAGETLSLNREKALRQVQVKQRHYQAMIALVDDEELLHKMRETLENLNEIEEELNDDKRKEKALSSINQRAKQNTNNYWWAAV